MQYHHCMWPALRCDFVRIDEMHRATQRRGTQPGFCFHFLSRSARSIPSIHIVNNNDVLMCFNWATRKNEVYSHSLCAACIVCWVLTFNCNHICSHDFLCGPAGGILAGCYGTNTANGGSFIQSNERGFFLSLPPLPGAWGIVGWM